MQPKSLNLAALATILILAANPAQAAGCQRQEFEAASKLYANGNINEARAAFLEFVRKYPGTYQGHYQLANTYMRGGDLHAARQQYAQAVNNNPDTTTLSRSLAAMGQIDREVARREAVGQTTSNSPVEASEKESADDSLQKQAETWQQARQIKLERDRTAILEDARKRASAVREAARRQLAELEANHNWICEDELGRLVGNVVPTEVRNSIIEPAEAEANRILAEGQRRADGLAIPGNLSDASESLRRQAKMSGCTPKIDLTHSSLTVRNYIHNKQAPQASPRTPAGTGLIAGKAVKTQ